MVGKSLTWLETMQIAVSRIDFIQTVGRESYFYILNMKQGFNFQILCPNERDQNCEISP